MSFCHNENAANHKNCTRSKKYVSLFKRVSNNFLTFKYNYHYSQCFVLFKQNLFLPSLILLRNQTCMKNYGYNGYLMNNLCNHSNGRRKKYRDIAPFRGNYELNKTQRIKTSHKNVIPVSLYIYTTHRPKKLSL